MDARDYYDREVYRRRMAAGDLSGFTVTLGESDLHISAAADLSAAALRALRAVRGEIETYIREHPGFRDALDPWPSDGRAPPVIREMIAAGRATGVGPMAAVAGAVAGHVGKALLADSPEVVVENGGDIFMAGRRARVAAVFAGESKLSMKLGLRLPPAPEGLGLCTSSGTVGPSLSFGKADAAVALATDPALADACATALGNRVKSAADLSAAMDWAATVPGLDGVLAIIDEDLAAQGRIELVEI